MTRPGGACSSYLVRTDEAALLFDIGSGAFGKLELAIEYPKLDAIVISHMHADHFFDLVPYRYALRHGHLRSERKVALWLPPNGRMALEALRKALAPDAPADFFDRVFAIREYNPAEALQVRDLRVRFCRTRHYIAAYAARAQSDGASITYSADTAPCDEVVDLARGTSLFLCETALGLGIEHGERGHSSAQEAGEMASRANAGRLVLTHYSAAYAPGALVDAAKRDFSGQVDAAEDGMEIAI
jgi:ribonuclease BN (tRNA processing enzyme)